MFCEKHENAKTAFANDKTILDYTGKFRTESPRLAYDSLSDNHKECFS